MPTKRGGKKNRKHNSTRKNTSKCKSHKRGHRAAESEKERIEQHKLVNSFKAAASANLFKTTLPHKFTKADNLHIIRGKESKPGIGAEVYYWGVGVASLSSSCLPSAKILKLSSICQNIEVVFHLLNFEVVFQFPKY